MVVVCLVEEDVLPVLDSVVIGREFLENAAGTDSVLTAELLPELCADLIEGWVLWLPHWPIWMVMISRGISNIQMNTSIIM